MVRYHAWLVYALSLVLVMVSCVAVSAAAHADTGPAGAAETMAAMSTSHGPEGDCPSHHDGHDMQVTKCALACFTQMPATVLASHSLYSLAKPRAEAIAPRLQHLTAYLQAIPTPPPTFG